MYEDLKKNELIKDMQEMLEKAEEFKNDMDKYCEFMRQVFLNTSCLN
jgi:hypothetical protein